MNRFLNIPLLLLCVFWASGCGSEKNGNPTETELPRYTLVFLDKTQSVNVNKEYVVNKYRLALTELLEQNMRKRGDRLEVYFIHENTAKAKALSLEVRSEKEDTEGVSPTDREAIETSFQLALQKEKGLYLRQLLLKLNQENSGASNQSTDILATVPLIAKANEVGAEMKVYFFSDMIESVQAAGRRDFHKTPPTSDQEAEAWAKADAKTWQKFMIGSPEITIISPFEPTASTREHNPQVALYWQNLFQELGASQVEEL